jgi:hypothetical protein
MIDYLDKGTRKYINWFLFLKSYHPIPYTGIRSHASEAGDDTTT